jgi:hypothetical protein
MLGAGPIAVVLYVLRPELTSSISVLVVGAGIGAHSAAVHCTAVDSACCRQRSLPHGVSVRPARVRRRAAPLGRRCTPSAGAHRVDTRQASCRAVSGIVQPVRAVTHRRITRRWG